MQTEDKLLRSLAAAMTANPRASLAELAHAVGVGKTTLYRFCPKRELLVDKLLEHIVSQSETAFVDVLSAEAPALETLRKLIAIYLADREHHAFIAHNWRDELFDYSDPKNTWVQHERMLDAFFLRGQHEGVFRIDINASVLADIFWGVLCSVTDSERRGRIARANMAELVEQLFLHGVMKR